MARNPLLTDKASRDLHSAAPAEFGLCSFQRALSHLKTQTAKSRREALQEVSNLIHSKNATCTSDTDVVLAVLGFLEDNGINTEEM